MAPAWTHAGWHVTPVVGMTQLLDELRRQIGAPVSQPVTVATSFCHTISPVPTLLRCAPQVRYATAAIHAKAHASFALLSKPTAEHVYLHLPEATTDRPLCIRHGSTCAHHGGIDILLCDDSDEDALRNIVRRSVSEHSKPFSDAVLRSCDACS